MRTTQIPPNHNNTVLFPVCPPAACKDCPYRRTVYTFARIVKVLIPNTDYAALFADFDPAEDD